MGNGPLPILFITGDTMKIKPANAALSLLIIAAVFLSLGCASQAGNSAIATPTPTPAPTAQGTDQSGQPAQDTSPTGQQLQDQQSPGQITVPADNGTTPGGYAVNLSVDDVGLSQGEPAEGFPEDELPTPVAE